MTTVMSRKIEHYQQCVNQAQKEQHSKKINEKWNEEYECLPRRYSGKGSGVTLHRVASGSINLDS